MDHSSSSPTHSEQPARARRERQQLTVSGSEPNLAGLAAALGLAFVAGLVLLVYLVHPPTSRLSYGTLAARSWDVLAFSAAVGLASAAILQVAKQVFGLRSIWQRRWIRRWIGSRGAVKDLWKSWLAAHADLPIQATGTPGLPQELDRADAAVVEQQVAAWEQLQTALLGAYAERDLRLVFDLPVEQLCALLATAADYALTSPQDNAELLLALSGPTGLDDIDLVAPPRSIETVKRTSGIGYRIDRSPDPRPSASPSTITTPGTDLGTAAVTQSVPDDDAALGRLARSVRSGLDVLQATMTERWSRAVRTWAVAISGVLGTVIVLFIRLSSLERILFAVAALLLGGFFAWLFRDLTAVVERVRS